MQGVIPEDEFLQILRRGTRRAADFMANLTEYHGGPIRTEYILTTDIAREFLEKRCEVRVEFLYRKLLCSLVKRKQWKISKKLGSKRADIAVTFSDILPRAIVEVKIGVGKTLSKVRGDLEKIINLIESIDSKHASVIRAASVFEVHLQGRTNDIATDRLKRSIKKVEKSLEDELKKFAREWPDFCFEFVPLQDANEGIIPTEVFLDEDNTGTLGQNGHATRYYAILIKSVRS